MRGAFEDGRTRLCVYSRSETWTRSAFYEQDEDTWVATSPEVPNWTVVADSCDEAHRLAEDGVRFALDRDDLQIKHFVPAPA